LVDNARQSQKPQNREAPDPRRGKKMDRIREAPLKKMDRFTDLMNNKQKYKPASLLPLWGLGGF
jgi:hypothetical protein